MKIESILRENKKRAINDKKNRSSLNVILIYFFNQKWVKKSASNEPII